MISCNDDDSRENVDFTDIIRTIRHRLKKYIYRRHQSNFSDQSNFVLIDNKYGSNYRQNESSAGLADNMKRTICGHCRRRRVKTNTSIIRFCRTCRFSIRKRKVKSNQMQPFLAMRRSYAPQIDRCRTNDRMGFKTMTPSHSTDIVEKLNRLGTSIHYESDCKYCLSNKRPANAAASVISNAHEIDTMCGITQRKIQKNHPTTESNEILITFDTVVTEVFPIDSLCGSMSPTDCIDTVLKPNYTEITVPNIQDILKNVPKSLSITIS